MLRLSAPLAFALSLLPGSADGTQAERELSDGDLKALGEGFATYFAARESATFVEAAHTVLIKELGALQKKLEGRDPLGQVADLGRAVWLARGYGDVKLRKGKVTTETFAHPGIEDGLEYAYRIPKSYDADKACYPVLLVIPDEDETPAEHLRTHWSSREIRDGVIVLCPGMPADKEEWDRVVVDGKPGGLSHLLTGLRIASERFAVDFDRVFVAGRGKGVPAALAAGNYSPQRFAGIIGRAGDAGELAPDNFGNLPTYFAGGGARATAFRDATVSAGFENCTVEPGGDETSIWRWMQKHPRKPFPASVTVVPGNPFPTRAYWLRVAPSGPLPRATAEIEDNTITVTGSDVSHATLYLNDALVDLAKPVRIVCNGVETNAVLRRHLPSALAMLWNGTSDPGCVYVSETLYPMSGEESASASASAPDPESDERLAAAAADTKALWEFYQWCASTQREQPGQVALHRIVRLAPDHADARAALGHTRGAEHWFTSDAARARFEQSQDAGAAQAKGHVEYKGRWMHRAERSRVTKGATKEPETGVWSTGADRKKLAKGWARQDLDWIEPDQAERVDEGLWRVDGEWVELGEANRRHAKIDSMWRIPTADVLLYTTTDREVALRALEHMRRGIDDVWRVFGAEPVLPLPVGLMRDEEQYDRFAFGDPDGRRRATHAGRLQIIHSAFFAESWFPLVDGKPQFRGLGVGYWDALAPHGDAYGVHAARLAAALSYVDALDPSPKIARKAAAAGGAHPAYYNEYEAEKQLPAWLRYGAAVYAERFFLDRSVAEGGDPLWARKWSLENLRNHGGLGELKDVLAFELDPDQRKASQKLLIEAGLLVAFLVDGENASVREAHAELRRALVEGRLHAKHVAALTEALLASEEDLRAFAEQ
ncbi:MAG: hypothetical protein GY711_09405 [bacterium]|nr:hypothetical protein [bacterium]